MYIVTALAAVLVWLVLGGFLRSDQDVPTVGSRLLFGYPTALRAMLHSKAYLLDGYKKCKDRTFRLPGLFTDTYYVSNPQLITEVRRAHDDTLSFQEVLNDAHQVRWTLGKAISQNYWHFGVMRKVLSTSLADGILPGLYEEIRFALEKALALPETGDWKSVKCYDMITDVMVHANNRMQVGLPLCRDNEYHKLTRRFPEILGKAALILGIFPTFMRSLVVRFTAVPVVLKQGEGFLVPVIEERLRSEEVLSNDGIDKPNDFVQWLIDAAPSEQRDTTELARRVVSMSLAGTHTSSMGFARAFYSLLVHPQYVQELREEVELAIKDYGFTKDGINAMSKVDSFFRESMRLTGIGLSSLNRKVLRPMALSDGTVLPKGAEVAANSWAIHHDPSIYPDPDTFDPFRFSRKVEQGESAAHNAFWSSNSDYLVWGLGSHVCAGRQFASQALKATMAELLLKYEFRLLEGKRPPKDIFISVAVLPDLKAHVEFRKRQV